MHRRGSDVHLIRSFSCLCSTQMDSSSAMYVSVENLLSTIKSWDSAYNCYCWMPFAALKQEDTHLHCHHQRESCGALFRVASPASQPAKRCVLQLQPNNFHQEPKARDDDDGVLFRFRAFNMLSFGSGKKEAVQYLRCQNVQVSARTMEFSKR